ncbi:hypothetical protein HWC35_gp048 [Vibrio phage USC-1]|uniref:Virion structural protein n=2 Tax=Aphroditevirus USC1 TaxID=2846605 RepID=A0A514A2J2_9CAUD|nr:hypothetical protein HWC35_gp048 [Vibrio phage USC-1]QCW23286.1 hypothetical protein [Vibrio phage 5 TSL-2019]QDH47442.1 hypothetical protein [Vibrio phage USC-1]
MENIEFNAHVESVLSLMRTLVIKCEAIGVTDNRLLAEAGYPVSQDKRKWRYYLNMTGEYHETDEPMYVASIDNGDQILFSKVNLDIHLATRRAYQPGSYWYKRLTEEHPGQIDLINGIIDPINMEDAIAAEDYKILRYNKDLIEANEDQLIPGLQQWINAYTQRHFKTDYMYTENLQLPIDLATMYGLMIPLVLILRLEAFGTRNVSDYHVWNRLNSYGDFRTYRTGLGQTQKMWLYRNIEYLRNNLGKNFTLEQLISNLLTPESIPIFHYRSIINTEQMETDQGQPEGLFVKERLNFKELEYDTGERFTNSQLLSFEEPMARDNALLKAYHEVLVEPESKETTFNDLSTKVLDSTMEDYTNRHDDTLMKTLFHEWIYTSKHKLYESIVDFIDPLNGNHVRLNTHDALIYWQLLLRSYLGTPVEVIEPFWFQWVMTKDLRDFDTFRAAGPSPALHDSVVIDIRKQWVPKLKVISPDAFFDQCFAIHQAKWKAKKIYSQHDELYQHAYTKECVRRLYDHGVYYLHDPAVHPSTQSWLDDKELHLGDYSKSELIELCWEIFTKATGWDVKGVVSLRQIQSNLVSLMTDLSSYTIQILKDIDDGNTTAENTDNVHLGLTGDNQMSNVGDYLANPLVPVDIHAVPLAAMNEYLITIDDRNHDVKLSASTLHNGELNVGVGVTEIPRDQVANLRVPVSVGVREATWAY